MYSSEENHVRKGILLAIGALVFLTGCGNQGNNASNVPVTPKWKVPYRLAFDTTPTKPTKPIQADTYLPPIKYTANPDALETRVSLVVRFDASGVKKDTPVMDQGHHWPLRYPRRGGRTSTRQHGPGE